MATANTDITKHARSRRPPNIPGAFNSLNGPKIGPDGFRCLPFDRREPVRQMNGHPGSPTATTAPQGGSVSSLGSEHEPIPERQPIYPVAPQTTGRLSNPRNAQPPI